LLILGPHGLRIMATFRDLWLNTFSTMQATRTLTLVLSVATNKHCCSSSGSSLSCWFFEESKFGFEVQEGI
jgi:hypothetical protein